MRVKRLKECKASVVYYRREGVKEEDLVPLLNHLANSGYEVDYYEAENPVLPEERFVVEGEGWDCQCRKTT